MKSFDKVIAAINYASNQSRKPNGFIQSYSSAVSQALDAAAKEAVDIVKETLSVKYDGESSAPKHPPKMRTGTLKNSIHWRSREKSRQFPAPGQISKDAFKRFKQDTPSDYRWYKQIRSSAYADPKMSRPYPKREKGRNFVRIIEVDPKATDNSDRQRLEYYSFYLESGWWSVVNPDHLDKGYSSSEALYDSGDDILLLERARKPGQPVFNEPRPYLSLLETRFASRLVRLYRTSLKNAGVPDSLASQAELKVKFNLGRRVPFYRDNK